MSTKLPVSNMRGELFILGTLENRSIDVGTSAVDVQALQEQVSGRWGASRHRVLDHLADHPIGVHPDLDTAAYRARITEALVGVTTTGIQNEGFGTPSTPSEDPVSIVAAIESLAVADLSLMVKAGVQWGLFGGAIHALGTAEHHRQYLQDMQQCRLFGAFAMTERGHGSDVQSLLTTATYDVDAEEFVIHSPSPQAQKDYIGNAARDGQLAVVFAQLITGGQQYGVHALVVPIRDSLGENMPGVNIEDCGRKAGLNGVDNGRLMFNQVRVPRTALLDRYGHVAPDGSYSSPIEGTNRRFFTMLGTLVRGRITVAGAAAMGTKKALTIAIRYADRRRQFDRPDDGGEVAIIDYLAHQRRLFIPLAKTYALHFAQEELLASLAETLQADTPGSLDQRELENRAAGIKAVSTRHATDTIQACREACGGAGYLDENQLPGIKADTDVFTTFEGDNTVLLQLVGKGLMTQFRGHLGDLDRIGVLKFAASQVVQVIGEKSTLWGVARRLARRVRHRGQRHALGGRARHLELFRDREDHQVETLARRLRSSRSESTFTTMNRVQPHLLRIAQTHINRVLLESFARAIDSCPDQGTRAVLNTLCDLYVMSELESDAAWLLEHDEITAAQSKNISLAVDRLCQGLRPHAVALANGLAIPEAFITAPMLASAASA